MSRTILIEELHLGVRAPSGLTEAAYQAIRLVLNDRRFLAELGRAVREVASRRPALSMVRLVLSR
jgi:hypothetical protein